jgi:hypothetical protein
VVLGILVLGSLVVIAANIAVDLVICGSTRA